MLPSVGSVLLRYLYPHFHSSIVHSGQKMGQLHVHRQMNGYTMECCCSVTQSCLTLCDPMDISTPGFPVLHHLLEFAQTYAQHLILCCPLLLLSSIFPSIRVFSNESVLRIRWPEYWSFSFSISPSSEYSVLISFRINYFVLLADQGTHEFSPVPQFESIISLALSLLYGPTVTFIYDYWKMEL